MYKDILIRQLNEENELSKLDNEFSNITNKYKELIEKIPLQDILGKFDIPYHDSIDENYEETFNLVFNNPQKVQQLLVEFQKYPEWSEIPEVLQERDTIKTKYFKQLLKNIRMINDDRNNLFSTEYKRKIDLLADKGYILYFYEMPDENLEHTGDEKLEDYIIELYSLNAYQIFRYNFSEIFNITNFDNRLQEDKILDLKEVVSSLQNENYNSCGRTLFALLDNEYKGMSESVDKTKRSIRTKKIDNFIQNIDIEYYKNWWEKIKKYYELCNVNTKDQEPDNVNRHDLAHGIYNKRSTKEDCIKLMLLFMNMKKLRYIINNLNLLKEECINDIRSMNLPNL